MILAGIVLYNPEIRRLKENIDAILYQVDKVILIDNNSINSIDINQVLSVYPTISIIRNHTNKGIAKALNQEATYSLNNGYEWLLSIDQDSVVPKNLIAEYKKYTNIANIGMICCKIIDRNFGELDYLQKKTSGIEYVNTCITSASMIRITAWQTVEGFCDDMFIDSVDLDMCYSLIEKGYKILQTNNVSLLHEVGHSRKVHFLGKDEIVLNHSPLRYYYIVRNCILLGKRHQKLLKYVLHIIKRIILVNLYEANIYKKNKLMIKGLYHSIIGRYGKL